MLSIPLCLSRAQEVCPVARSCKENRLPAQRVGCLFWVVLATYTGYRPFFARHFFRACNTSSKGETWPGGGAKSRRGPGPGGDAAKCKHRRDRARWGCSTVQAAEEGQGAPPPSLPLASPLSPSLISRLSLHLPLLLSLVHLPLSLVPLPLSPLPFLSVCSSPLPLHRECSAPGLCRSLSGTASCSTCMIVNDEGMIVSSPLVSNITIAKHNLLT